jgi:NADH-quinone oxidoreductase subunit M
VTLTAILLPLISALLLLVAPRALQKAIVVISTVFTFLTALALPQVGPFEAPWLASLGVYLSLSPVGAGSVLVLSAALVMIPTALYASFVVGERTGAFLALLLAMQAGLNGIFLAQDLVLFYIFWEATLVPSLLLLGIWGLERRRQAALKYLTYAVAGSFLMLVAILALRPLSGAESFRFADLLNATQALPLNTQVWLFLAFTLAFAVKLPLWPLHGWLPDFHEQNHPSGVADVAGTLYKVGGWGFFAFALPLFPAAAALLSPYLLALAAFTALYAAVVATAQTNLKRLLAYASLSHMGIVGVGVFGLYLAGMGGAMYLLAAQMLSTGGLFLISGMLYARRGSFELSAYGGLAKSAPALAALTLFVTFASIGVPGLSNFPGEFLSLLGAFERSALLGSFATLSVVAAGVYGVNMYQRLYQVDAQGDVREVSRLELLALTPLVLGILWFGLFPQPQLARIEAQAVRAPTFDAPAVAAPISGVPESASPGLESPAAAPLEGDEGGH